MHSTTCKIQLLTALEQLAPAPLALVAPPALVVLLTLPLPLNLDVAVLIALVALIANAVLPAPVANEPVFLPTSFCPPFWHEPRYQLLY